MRILVTGSSGYLASLVLPRLLAPARELIGVDVRAPRAPAAGVKHVSASVLDPDLAELFRREAADLVLHLAWVFNPSHDREAMRQVDVEGTRNVLEAAAKAGVGHLIYLGSTTAYGAHPDNPARFKESDRARGNPDFAYSADKAAVDGLVNAFADAHPALGLTHLRAAIVLGRRVENFLRAILDLPVIPKVRGHDPELQFLHEEDLVEALTLVVERRPRGVFNIAPEATLKVSDIGPTVGRPMVDVPGGLLRLGVETAWRLRLFSTPAAYLSFITWPWLADVSKARDELGFVPRHTSREALASVRRRHFPG